MKKLNLLLTCTCALFALSVQGQKQLLLSSPDGKLKSTITVGDKLTYDISCNGQQVLAPSPISATLDNGKVWGDKARLAKVTEKKNDTQIDAPFIAPVVYAIITMS